MKANPDFAGSPTSDILGEEFKPWPTLPLAETARLAEWDKITDSSAQNGIAKLVSACAALHNNDGGVLHLGFDEKARRLKAG
jgi:hypothetical protein